MTSAARLYTPAGVAVGTLVGSLAAGAVLLWLNYRALGHARLANKVAAGALALYLMIVLVASQLPQSLALAVGFIAAQTTLAYWAARTLQGAAIDYRLARGGVAHSLLRAAAVGLLTAAAAALLLLVLTGLLGIPTATAAR